MKCPRCGSRRGRVAFDDQARQMEATAAGPSFETIVVKEFERSQDFGGRSVFGWEKPSFHSRRE